jgi:hypothetical protein
MKKLIASIKRRWDAYLERMVKANQENYGSERLDCCDLNNKKKHT